MRNCKQKTTTKTIRSYGWDFVNISTFSRVSRKFSKSLANGGRGGAGEASSDSSSDSDNENGYRRVFLCICVFFCNLCLSMRVCHLCVLATGQWGLQWLLFRLGQWRWLEVQVCLFSSSSELNFFSGPWTPLMDGGTWKKPATLTPPPQIWGKIWNSMRCCSETFHIVFFSGALTNRFACLWNLSSPECDLIFYATHL